MWLLVGRECEGKPTWEEHVICIQNGTTLLEDDDKNTERVLLSPTSAPAFNLEVTLCSCASAQHALPFSLRTLIHRPPLRARKLSEQQAASQSISRPCRRCSPTHNGTNVGVVFPRLWLLLSACLSTEEQPFTAAPHVMFRRLRRDFDSGLKLQGHCAGLRSGREHVAPFN